MASGREEPRPPAPRPAAPRPPADPRREPQREAPPVELPPVPPEELYLRLSKMPGRRGEKEAVVAAVWFASQGRADVDPEAVERHMRAHGGPPDVRVRPHLMKHVNRTKLLARGERPGSVRLTPKGVSHLRQLFRG